jgi:hypothetical protein
MNATLRAGEWVEVRSKEEILATLDSSGKLDGMHFMPEMFAFCGKKFQVHKRAHKTCDTVYPVRGRRVEQTVHLETRCDGQGHGGCQAQCLIFWKEAWLKPVSADSPANTPLVQIQPKTTSGCTESDVWRATTTSGPDATQTVYSCQATQLPVATKDLAWWDLRQYVEDFTSGNVGLWRIFSGLVYSSYYSMSQAGIGLGPAMRWIYDKFHPLWGGTPFPRKAGTIPVGQPTPTQVLNLQPGELVRVKSHQEILKTLTVGSRNRGMWWDAEMVPHCGQTRRVLHRVNKLIDEKTGVMADMKNPCIILDSVACESRFSACRMFCPRGIYPYWREIWLERIEVPVEKSSVEESHVGA